MPNSEKNSETIFKNPAIGLSKLISYSLIVVPVLLILYLLLSLLAVKKEAQALQAKVRHQELLLAPVRQALQGRNLPGNEQEQIHRFVRTLTDAEKDLQNYNLYQPASRLGFDGHDDNFKVKFSNKHSSWMQGIIAEAGDNQYVACDAINLTKCKGIIKLDPTFPFSYYTLAVCLNKNRDASWRKYAQEAIAILEKTTAIHGHSPDHDEALKNLRVLLED